MNGRRTTLATVAAMLFAVIASRGANSIQWDAGRERVNAVVETWTVPQVLQRVAGSTGWQIFVDPAITNRVSARFTDKQPGEALRKLLGDYNYILVPESNAPSKFFVFRTTRQQATRALEPIVASTGSTNRIGNEIVITLKPGEKIEDVAKRLGAKIVGRSDDQNTYRLRFEDEKTAETARAAAQNDSAVENVDSNYYVTRPETAQAMGTPGGPLALTPKASPDGKYTVVGLIDSGVQPKEGNFSDFILPGISVGETSTEGGPSHGTSMAEVILRALSVASEDKSTSVRLLPVNVFSESGEQTTTYEIAKGIYKAVNGGAMIVNLSMGGDGDSSFLYKTIKSAHDQGVVFIAAAGNEPVTTPTYPAAYSEVIAVTASDRSGKLASYANRGNFVDVIAPGGGVINYKGQQFYVVGTSTSTAFASGIAAAISEQTKQTGSAIEANLRKTLGPKTP